MTYASFYPFVAENAVLLSLAIPFIATVLCVIFRNMPNLRDGLTFLAALATFTTVLAVYDRYEAQGTFGLELFHIVPGIAFAFSIEPLGIVFALVASGLWIVTHLYGIGYMRGNNEHKQGRFFACFAFAIASAIGIAFSANLLTLFVFYELLTVSTYPLVAHKETPEAKAGGRTYIGVLMTTSICFLLVAIVWTGVVAGTLDFKEGGILAGKIDSLFAAILLGLFVFGIGKAAIMPFHRWLPAAMVAPTPVSALLHAVAVVKAGVFTVLKVGVYTFGIGFLDTTDASQWLMWLAAFSILGASIVAMTKDNLKARLAYSTVSQLSYITLGVALATSMGAVGGGLHIVTHAFGKITLFMCAGAIYVATHKTEISDMRGLGRTMPFTFVAFGIGALSIIGLPPLGGSWSKWLLAVGAADAQQLLLIAVLMISSLLNVAYLLPIVVRGFYNSPPPEPRSLSAAATERKGIAEAPFLCVLPPCLTALGCIVLFFYADDVVAFLEPLGSVAIEEAPDG